MAVGIFTVLALVELIVDQLPGTPSLARRLRSAFLHESSRARWSCACFAVAGGATPELGAPAGAIGAIAGAFCDIMLGRLVRALRVPDFVIAIAEDLVAIGLGVFLVSRF